MSSTDFDVLFHFQDVFNGMGRVSVQKPGGRFGKKELLRWSLTEFESVQAVLVMMWPWLGRRRRARMKEVLQSHCEHAAMKRVRAWKKRNVRKVYTKKLPAA